MDALRMPLAGADYICLHLSSRPFDERMKSGGSLEGENMRVTSRGPSHPSFLTAINSLLACGKLRGGITLPDQPQGGG